MEPERKAFFERLLHVYAELQEIMQLLPDLSQAQNYYRHSKFISPDITIIECNEEVHCLFKLKVRYTPTQKELKVSFFIPEDHDRDEDREP